MSLTQSDLKSIEVILDRKLDEKLEEKLEKKLKPIRRDLRVIKKDLDHVIGSFDARLNHLEKHSSHPPGHTVD